MILITSDVIQWECLKDKKIKIHVNMKLKLFKISTRLSLGLRIHNFPHREGRRHQHQRGYDTKLSLMMRHNFGRISKEGIHIHCYSSNVYSDPEWLNLFRSYLEVKWLWGSCFGDLRGRGVTFHCHYSLVHSEIEWRYLLRSRLWVK